MLIYVVVLTPLPDGRWRADIPDVEHCIAFGGSAEEALFAAARNLQRAIKLLKQSNTTAPKPRTIDQVRADVAWATAHSIDWTKTMISLAPAASSGWRALLQLPSLSARWWQWLRIGANAGGAGVWKFANSGFGLWFLTSVVLAAGSYWVPIWWHELRAEEESQIQLARVSREIICRLNAALSQAEEVETLLQMRTAPSEGADIDLVTELLSADGRPSRLCSLSAAAPPQTLHSVLTEWQRLVPAHPYAVWEISYDFSPLEKTTFTLLSPNEDITQLTDEIRGVAAKCARTALQSNQGMGGIAETRRCRIAEFKSAAAGLLKRVQRPIEAIVLQQKSSWGKVIFGPERKFKEAIETKKVKTPDPPSVK